MRRGDIVAVAMQGDFGKPRPALVMQADLFSDHGSVTVLPITETVLAAPLLRVTLAPSGENSLRKPSQVMVDKAVTVTRETIGQVIGQIDAASMVEIERRLAVFLGIAK